MFLDFRSTAAVFTSAGPVRINWSGWPLPDPADPDDWPALPPAESSANPSAWPAGSAAALPPASATDDALPLLPLSSLPPEVHPTRTVAETRAPTARSTGDRRRTWCLVGLGCMAM